MACRKTTFENPISAMGLAKKISTLKTGILLPHGIARSIKTTLQHHTITLFTKPRLSNRGIRQWEAITTLRREKGGPTACQRTTLTPPLTADLEAVVISLIIAFTLRRCASKVGVIPNKDQQTSCHHRCHAGDNSENRFWKD